MSLPEGWRWVRLGDVCDFAYGSGLRSDLRQSGEVPVYGSNGVVGYHDNPITSGPTIIIGRKGSVGEVHYSTRPCFPIDTTYYVEKTKVDIDLEWFAYCLRTLRLGELNKATAIPGLNRDDAYALKIPLPPLREQRRIAAILSEQLARVGMARAALEQQMNAARQLPPAYLREVFESELSKSWRWVRLETICDLVNGNAYKPSDWSMDGVRIIRIENLNDHSKAFNHWAGKLEKKVKVRSGDVLLAWSGTPGTSFGTHLWERGDAVLNQHIFRVDFTTRDILKEWFVLSVNERLDILIEKAHGGVGLRHVKKGEVEKLEIPLPSLSEQSRITANLTKQMAVVDKACAKLEEEQRAINKLPAALLGRAFNGEL